MNQNRIPDIVPPILDGYDMKNLSELEKIFEVFSVSQEEMAETHGNTGRIIDMKFPGSSKKAKDLFCVYIVLHQLRNLFVEPLTPETYANIYNGHNEDTISFINWIMNTIDSKIQPRHLKYRDNIRIIFEWNLKRTRGNLILDKHEEFYNIVEPPIISDPPIIQRLDLNFMDLELEPPQNAGTKRKQKSKKTKRSQKKRKVSRKTKKRRITKRK